jgi:hypothetical protein
LDILPFPFSSFITGKLETHQTLNHIEQVYSSRLDCFYLTPLFPLSIGEGEGVLMKGLRPFRLPLIKGS